MSNYDRALIIAQYNSGYKKNGIDPKIFENRTEAEIKYLRKNMGSKMERSCGLQFDNTFNEYPQYDHFNFVMSLAYTYNKNGTLPFSGGTAEQPSQIMEILELISFLDDERERAQAKKEKK